MLWSNLKSPTGNPKVMDSQYWQKWCPSSQTATDLAHIWYEWNPCTRCGPDLGQQCCCLGL